MQIRKTVADVLALFIFSSLLFAGGSKDWKGSNDRIEVFSRESGSGTGSVLIQIMNIRQQSGTVKIVGSTEAVIKAVAKNTAGIGYISLGALDTTVKALKIDGIKPSVSEIKAGRYKLSRHFVIVTREKILSEGAQDFIRFILSSDGQSIISRDGYIPVVKNPGYIATDKKGSVIIKGSSSVYPVMCDLADLYIAKNQKMYIQVMQTDSTDGIQKVLQGDIDIGMASRDIYKQEKEQGVYETVITIDGIAVIVNKSNPVKNLSSDTVRGIYAGDIQKWSETE